MSRRPAESTRARARSFPWRRPQLPLRFHLELLEDRSVPAAFSGINPAGSMIYQAADSGVAGTEAQVYLADFESGDQGFTVDNDPPDGFYLPGQWHLSTGRGAQPGHSASASFYYGSGEGADGGGTYSLGTFNPTRGTITSPEIALPDGPLTLTFNYVLETRAFPPDVDFATLEVNDGGGWTTLASYNGVAESSTWTASAPVDLTAYRGGTVQLRWGFDTVRGPVGRFPEGWYVDDVRITTLVPDAPDSIPITVDPGQTITVVVTPTDATLRPRVTLLAGATGTTVAGTATASAAGQPAVLQTIGVPGQIAGTGAQAYRIVIEGAGGTTGRYSFDTDLNAAAESEGNGGAANDTRADAQNIGGSFVQLHSAGSSGTQPARGAVLGTVDSAPGAPPIDEAEPNGSRSGAQDLDGATFTVAVDPVITDSTSVPHVTVLGDGDGTFDYYSFTVAGAGDRGIFDIDFENFDSMLFLYDSDGNLLAVSDDNGGDPGSGSGLASFIDFTFPAAGTYTIGVASFFSFNNGGEIDGTPVFPGSVYTLHVSLSGKPFVAPGPDVYGFELRAGSSATIVATRLGTGGVSVELQNAAGATVASGAGLNNYVVPAGGTYYAVVNGLPGTDYSLVVTRNAGFDTEHNDDLASAQGVLGNQVAGRQWVLGHVAGDGKIATNTVDNFDDGNVTEYTPVGSVSMSATAAAAHDGPYGLQADSNGGWMYRDDVQVQRGDVISVWVQSAGPTGAFNGRAYFAFGATASGALSMVMAPNTGELQLQRNALYGFETLGAVAQPWLADHWYRFEITWEASGNITGRLFDSDGTTLLNTVTGNDTTVASGGIGFRAFGSTKYFDTVVATQGTTSDFYQVTLAAGQPLEVETATPGGGAGAFTNLLDPVIRVYNSAGELVASDDNSAGDGRNARVKYNVPKGKGGTYYIEVASSSATPELTAGEYLLSVKGNTAGSAQYVGAAAGTAANGLPPLADADLRRALGHALDYWAARGVDTAAARGAGLRVDDMVDGMLGYAFEGSGVIVVDDDAGGRGWSFGPGGAPGTVDLYETVTHEVGHLLGFEHTDGHDVMRPTLAPIAGVPAAAAPVTGVPTTAPEDVAMFGPNVDAVAAAPVVAGPAAGFLPPADSLALQEETWPALLPPAGADPQPTDSSSGATRSNPPTATSPSLIAANGTTPADPELDDLHS